MPEEPIATPTLPVFSPLEEITAEPVGVPITPFAIALVLVAIPLAALIVGGMWHFVSYLSEFPILFPVSAGCGAGWAVGNALKWGKAKGAKWAAWSGLAAALSTVLSYHLWNAYGERPQIVDALTARAAMQYKTVPLPDLRRVVDRNLNVWQTLSLSLQSRAYVGTHLQWYSRRMPILTGRGVPFRGGWYWGLLVVDAAFAGFAGAALAENFVLRRCCPECGKPFKPYLLFQRKNEQADTMLTLTRMQDWDALKSLPKEKLTGKNHASVSLLQCEASGCPATVVVETGTDATPTRRLLNAWISPESAKAARAASFAELL